MSLALETVAALHRRLTSVTAEHEHFGADRESPRPLIPYGMTDPSPRTRTQSPNPSISAPTVSLRGQ